MIPWADMVVNPNLASWLDRRQIDGSGKTALVVGCGLGDDAEALASLGFGVSAFDISSTCIDWCRHRFPSSAVEYSVADLFDSPEAWTRSFDFVFESYTLQVLPPELRQQAMNRIGEFVRPNGTLLVVSRGRDVSDDPGQMPWPLVREELESFVNNGLTQIEFEDYIEEEDLPVRRFRVEYRQQQLQTQEME